MDAAPSRPSGAFGLHVLVSRLDRDADRILRAEFALPYARFLFLLALDRTGPATQRALADELGVTEPTVSRTVGILAARGLITAGSVPGAGNRRTVALTDAGRALVTASARRLEGAFAGLLAAAGIAPSQLDDLVARLLATLDRPAG